MVLHTPGSLHRAGPDRLRGAVVASHQGHAVSVNPTPRPAQSAGHGRSSGRTVAVDVADPELDADVRAVLAALALDPGPRGRSLADVVVTDRSEVGRGVGEARVVRVAAEAGGGDDGEVIRLPSGTSDLVGALMTPVAAQTGRLVAVVGAVGGCGTSTLAAALAVRAAARGRALLVETDSRGTGIDLILGAESAPGLRVEDVRADLGGPDPDAVWDAVPLSGAGCRVLARARGREAATGAIAADGALGAALSHRATGGLVVCDAGGVEGDAPVLVRADLVVVVTRADLQGAVAAGRTVGDLRRPTLVVRTQRGDPLHAADVADSAGSAAYRVLPQLRAVRQLAGSGDLGRALGRSRGGRVRSLAALADAVLGEVLQR